MFLGFVSSPAYHFESVSGSNYMDPIFHKVGRMRRLLTRAKSSKKKQLEEFRQEIAELGLPEAALQPDP